VSRIARVVIPGLPHHVVQRGNRRQQVFFCDQDRLFYIRLLKKYGDQESLSYWAYCLMPNHVHLIVVPKTTDGLSEVMAVANRKYALATNLREDWKGCLWQGRFYSCPLDHFHLIAAVRYIERNPVRAGIVRHPADYPWSSATSHIHSTPDMLILKSELTEEISDWDSFLNQEEPEENIKRLRSHLNTGRPLGNDDFIDKVETVTGRKLRRLQPGRKPRLALPETLRSIDFNQMR
jgi:putative transposase